MCSVVVFWQHGPGPVSMRHLTLAVPTRQGSRRVCAQAANAEWVPCVESGWGRCTPGARGEDPQERG